jgi:hypothetical protein
LVCPIFRFNTLPKWIQSLHHIGKIIFNLKLKTYDNYFPLFSEEDKSHIREASIVAPRVPKARQVKSKVTYVTVRIRVVKQNITVFLKFQ